MLDTVDFNHVQHISFTQSCPTDAVSVILSELLSYEHRLKGGGIDYGSGFTNSATREIRQATLAHHVSPNSPMLTEL